MRRGAVILTTVITTVAVIGAGAMAWHLSEPWRERRTFMNKCLANKFTEPTCACTYSAHKELSPTYAALVKSIVHDDMTTFATRASVIFGRNTVLVGTGVDPAEITSMLSAVEDKTVSRILRETGKFLVRHKYKAIGAALGGAKAMAVYRAGRVGVEVGQAAVVVERHCGIVTGAIPSTWALVEGAAGRALNAAQDAADATWRGTKTVAGKAWDGTKYVADKTWDGTKGAASWTWEKAQAAGKLVGLGREDDSKK